MGIWVSGGARAEFGDTPASPSPVPFPLAMPIPSPGADAAPDDSDPSAPPEFGVPNQAVPVAAERWVWLTNNANEEVAVAYRSGETYNPLALARLQHLFRDLREDAPGPLPPLLIDMLSLLQEAQGYQRPFRVISGFRTIRTNMSLEHAAPNSKHLHGMAADIVVPRVAAGDMAMQALELSYRFGFMGVGFYRQFTHVDVGPRASWANFAA